MFTPDKSIAVNDRITIHGLDEFFSVRLQGAPKNVEITREQLTAIRERFTDKCSKIELFQNVNLESKSLLVKCVYAEGNEKNTLYAVVTTKGGIVILQNSHGYNCELFVSAVGENGVLLRPCLYSEIGDTSFSLSNRELGELIIVYIG